MGRKRLIALSEAERAMKVRTGSHCGEQEGTLPGRNQ